jgi:hypothetical protein
MRSRSSSGPRPTRLGFPCPSTRSTSASPWACRRRGRCRREPSFSSAPPITGRASTCGCARPTSWRSRSSTLRSHPSGSQPARPMHYGQLLADFNKGCPGAPGRLRLVVLVADDGYVQYVGRSGRSVLPLRTGGTASISRSSLGRLADTPRKKAETYGAWRGLRATLRWSSKTAGCSLFAWEVTPGSDSSQTVTD